MLKTNKSVENRLLSKVSSMYYDQNYNQREIANRLNLSRPKVSRLLKQAREEGIVQISVVSPSDSFVDLENSLEEKFDLQEALITEVEPQSTNNFIKRQIGSASANYLHRTISDDDIIGVTWGTTLQAMVDAMPSKQVENTHVVQALGGVGPPEAKTHATDISRRLSQLLNSRLTLLPAPGIVGSIEAKKVLLSDRQVRGALDLFSKINTLYVGIGAINTNPVLHKDSQDIPPKMLEKIKKSKAVGDIALHFFDDNGDEIDSELRDLIIGISIEELKQVDTVVGIAGGKEKADVIYGALKGNLIDVLITDLQTANEMLSR